MNLLAFLLYATLISSLHSSIHQPPIKTAFLAVTSSGPSLYLNFRFLCFLSPAPPAFLFFLLPFPSSPNRVISSPNVPEEENLIVNRILNNFKKKNILRLCSTFSLISKFHQLLCPNHSPIVVSFLARIFSAFVTGNRVRYVSSYSSFSRWFADNICCALELPEISVGLSRNSSFRS